MNEAGINYAMLSQLQAKEMIQRIKKAFVDNLPNLSWMDNQTRIAAIGKVRVKIDDFRLFIYC